MKKALGLSFFDKINEIPRELDPIWKEFNYIIAVDGRYKNYEADHDFSIDGSYELIQTRYPNAIMDRLCAFEPQKRQRYLDIAGKLGCDYLVVFDTDEYIHPDFQDWPLFWHNLERTSERHPDYRLFKMKMWIPTKEIWSRGCNKVRTNTWKNCIRIHKNPGEQRYCMNHHFYWCHRDTTDEDILCNGGKVYGAFKNAIEGVRFTCDSLLRSADDLQKRDDWSYRNQHDERRRLYYLNCDYKYNMKHEPFNENELFYYGRKGKILDKKIIDNQ